MSKQTEASRCLAALLCVKGLAGHVIFDNVQDLRIERVQSANQRRPPRNPETQSVMNVLINESRPDRDNVRMMMDNLTRLLEEHRTSMAELISGAVKIIGFTPKPKLEDQQPAASA